jgi:uncharacterized membrane protein YphA (DoxX/SURF4 family)
MKINRIILIIIGALYLFSGFTKAIDSQWFAVLIATYGFPWAGNISPVISGVEIVLGLCLILDIKPKITSLLVGLLTIIFTIIFAYGFFTKGVDDCGCMGPFIRIPSHISFARNILIIIGCYWIWDSVKNDNEPIPNWKKWVIYVIGSLSFCLAGSTLGMQLVDKSKIKVGDEVDATYLQEFQNIIGKGRSYVFIFSPGCGHCWNMTENVKTYKSIDTTNNVIGVTFPDEDTTKFMQEMRPNFKIFKYPTNELRNIFEIPTFLVLENGRIIRIFKSDKIPCAQMLKFYEDKDAK